MVFPPSLPANLNPPSSTQDALFGVDFLYDFEAGDIVLDGLGDIRVGDRLQALITWASKAIVTPRGVFAAYSDQFGIDFDGIRAADRRDVQVAETRKAVSDAVLDDLRVNSIDSFEAVYDGDVATVGFTIFTALGETAEVTEVQIG